MEHLSVEQLLGLAIEQHQAGQLANAETTYRQILIVRPNQPDALHLLGLIAHQQGRHESAIETIRLALAIKPNWPEACYNLGIALFALGRTDDAITAYRRAIEINPNFADAYNSLGNALRKIRKPSQAAQAFHQAIILRPGYADAHNNFGNALRDLGQIDRAIEVYQQAIALQPNYPQAHNNLAVALQETGRLHDAIAAYRKAISLKPDYAESGNNLGIALREDEQLDAAIAAHQNAIALKPDWPEAHNCLGNALVLQGQLDGAISAYRTAINLKPTFADARYNLGKTFFDAGEVDLATDSLRKASALKPEKSSFASAVLFAMYYDPACDPQAVADSHFQWGRDQSVPSDGCSHQPHNQNGRLRIGYISPDFRNHPVGRFILPLLEQHDREQFEVFCYSDAIRSDAITARVRSHCDHWHETAKRSHDQLAALIHSDRIDILVDLTGHTTGSRLLTFARKPAPLQVSYLGYPGTTGLTQIDYRLTDTLTDPPGLTERLHSEALCRLPRTNWCFAEHEPSPPIVPPPLLELGHVTFGSFNNFARVTDRMLQTWAMILQQVPSSRLILKAAAFVSDLARNRAGRTLTDCGIDTGRLTLLGVQADHAAHLAGYNQIDIALDTFPYHGTTTTCDALWMGVPVITLAGHTHVSRVGVSLLTAIGLPELIATSASDYVERAVSLANAPNRLSQLRRDLREKMKQSPLMDAPAFARDVEAAYLWMCSNRKQERG
jgi:predicted O-linked N-acetylglucosamine transferase (SPINDLY family)